MSGDKDHYREERDPLYMTVAQVLDRQTHFDLDQKEIKSRHIEAPLKKERDNKRRE